MSSRPAASKKISDVSEIIQIGSRERKTTKTALTFTYITLALFVAVSIYVHLFETKAQDPYDGELQQIFQGRRMLENDNNGIYADENCEDIFEVTSDENKEDRCLFAQTCNNNDGFPFTSFVFCSSRFTSKELLILFSVPLFIILVLLFRMLGSTAEDYFSPSLEMFSKKFGLPPRFAGVTLLALGNGAADVSAIMSAVTSNPETGYLMALGSLTGGGMFIGTVVAGVVIVTAGDVTCRGALVRDVCALAITVMVVFTELKKGKIGQTATFTFFFLYFFFVGIVLIADVYHRQIVLPRMQKILDQKERLRQLQDEKNAKELAGEAVDELAAGELSPISLTRSSSTAVSAILTALSNYERVDEDSIQATKSNEGWGFEPDEKGMESMITLHGKHGIITNNHHGAANNGLDAMHEAGHSPYHAMTDHFGTMEISDEHSETSNTQNTWRKTFETNYSEFIDHWKEYLSDIFQNENVHILDKFFLAIELPFTIARQVTVPIPTDGYYCRSLIALSCALSSIWLAIYFWMQYDVNLFQPKTLLFMLAFISIMIITCIAILRFAPTENDHMPLTYSGPIALYGFVIAATWIDFIADNLVNLLQFFGILFHIPSSILGITILAWGNSMGDLSANMTMARKGLSNMAITACFAGPIFNILIGLASGFSALRHIQDKDEIEVTVSSSITVGFVFLILNSIFIIGTGVFICNGVVPKAYGYFAWVLYSIYIITSICVQFKGQ